MPHSGPSSLPEQHLQTVACIENNYLDIVGGLHEIGLLLLETAEFPVQVSQESWVRLCLLLLLLRQSSNTENNLYTSPLSEDIKDI